MNSNWNSKHQDAPTTPAPSLADYNGPAAKLALQLLERLDFDSRRKHPSVLTVFRLYCIQQMTVPQIARHCRCSRSTVSDRLKVLRAKTGLSAKQFRQPSRWTQPVAGPASCPSCE